MEERAKAELAGRLHSVAIQLLRRVRREDAASGLSAARLSALSVLVFGGPRTAGELAAAEQVSAPTITRLIGALEAEGYVTRAPNPVDGRSVIVRATPRAGRALAAARSRRIRHLLGLLEELGREDWVRLEAAVELLEGALSATARTPAPPST